MASSAAPDQAEAPSPRRLRRHLLRRERFFGGCGGGVGGGRGASEPQAAGCYGERGGVVGETGAGAQEGRELVRAISDRVPVRG